ncbi:MAG TPA: isoprenylcysteine carboxylmethyltransferase family protein [Polyangiaceae bacterium]
MLLFRALSGLVFLGAVMAGALFGCAGTTRWLEAWIFLAVFLGASLLVTIDLARRDPALLERRTHAGPLAEPTTKQKIIQLFASLAFLAELALPALDRRFGWTHVPASIAYSAEAFVALGFFIVFRVFRANTFTSALIEVGEKQHVITTGPYAIVRHPMYAGAFVLLLAAPIALGSLAGLAAFPLLVAVIVVRMLDEERVLARDLEGYDAYRKKTRSRLVPGVF